MLKVENLRIFYDSLETVKGISIAVPDGHIVTILGANGAGKTTTLRAIAGLNRPKEGRIVFNEKDISGRPSHEIATLGIRLIPEGRQLFPDHNVRENLEMGAYLRLRRGERKQVMTEIEELFGYFPQIRNRIDQLAGTLSGGEQQMVAILRALIGRPKLLLMDEPSLGLAPFVVKTIFGVLNQLRERAITVLLVEQMASFGLGACDYGYILESGRIVLEGSQRELLSHPRVLEAYLGKNHIRKKRDERIYSERHK